MFVNYDGLAEQYKKYRKPDVRIAARIHRHVRAGQRVLNVGAGMGSYEPENCPVVAVEPSAEMIARRKKIHAALIRGSAEGLPFGENGFDISMALLTIHHWADTEAGLREMVRVTKDKIILFTWIGYGSNFWLEDYIPEIKGVDIKLFPTIEDLKRILGNISVETIEIPFDCTDGFMCAYWRRPAAYLDPKVRKAISTFSRIADVQDRLMRLKADIKSGAWHDAHRHLLDKESLDLGYRLVVCER